MPGEHEAGPQPQTWEGELDDLRRRLLPTLAALTAVAGWAWFGLTIYKVWDLGASVPPTIVLLLAAGLAHLLGRRHYDLACWSLLTGLVTANGLLVAGHPSSGFEAYGVLAIMAANALLGTPQAVVVTALTWLANSTVRSAGGLPGPLVPEAATTLVLYGLALGLAWLSARPLRSSTETALEGWRQAREAVREVRERRAELYRVVRALDEATSRIEHMNVELAAKRREAELARAQKARFVATVSHELRGPLNLILGFSKLMALSPEEYHEPLPASYHADVDAIYRNSQHLAALLDDILDLTQIEAERLPLVKDRLDLEVDVVKKVVAIVKPLAERKGLYLRQELAGDLPWVLADQVRLRQALLNLLTNAIRFTERGGVVVRTARDGDSLAVSIHDTGPGIADKDMPRLFREFHQLHRTSTREGAGSGLGLSISKQLIELHGGQIWAESKQGQGTTFCFTVPLLGGPSTGFVAGRPDAVPQRASVGRECLIVHDDPAVVRLLARYLEGYRVMGLPDEKAVAAAIEHVQPRAIITTPERSRRIAAQLSQGPYDVPIITCGMPRIKEQERWRGILGYLVKPFSVEMLAGVMSQVERNGETTILLVDDDPDAVRLMETMLTRVPRPYKVLRAYTGLQALERMEAVIPDVVFMDEVMPELTGHETVARMRADERLREIPVVIVSAQDWSERPLAVKTPISVRRRECVDVASAARCLQTLLDEVSPHYLVETGELGPSLAGPSG